MRIAVLVNLSANAPTYPGMPADRWDDLDSAVTPDGICASLGKLGHTTAWFEANINPPYNLIERLREYAPEVCFNIAESHFGTGREAYIPALLEMLGIPYTGSGVVSLGVALDKMLTKRILRDYGLPTAEFQLFTRADEALDAQFLTATGELRYPLFVKPNSEGTSMGVDASSLTRSPEETLAQVHKLLERYNPILVERYVPGREVLVGMIGNPGAFTFLPITEIDYAAYGVDHPGYYTNAMKTTLSPAEYFYHCPAHLNDTQVAELHDLAARAFAALDCRDVARVDFRLDSSQGGKPYILEVNPLPGLSPGYSDLCLQALAMNWEHEQLVGAIVDAAVKRGK